MNNIQTAEDFINEMDSDWFHGHVFSEMAYRTNEVIKGLQKFAQIHLENFKEELKKELDSYIKKYPEIEHIINELYSSENII